MAMASMVAISGRGQQIRKSHLKQEASGLPPHSMGMVLACMDLEVMDMEAMV